MLNYYYFAVFVPAVPFLFRIHTEPKKENSVDE